MIVFHTLKRGCPGHQNDSLGYNSKNNYIIWYNIPCSLRVSVGVLYKLDNCAVELYNVLQISFMGLGHFGENTNTSIIYGIISRSLRLTNYIR